MLLQGFRKYLTQAKDHEELLSFLLGQIVKEKVRYYQLQHHEQPDKVSINVSELDEKASLALPQCRLTFLTCLTGKRT